MIERAFVGFALSPWPYVLLALSSLPFFWGAFRQLKRRRLVLNMPTSRCAGVALGLTELKGRCEAYGALLESPLARRPCVHFTYKIEEYRHVDGQDVPQLLEIHGESIPFAVRDESGQVPVLPEGAKIDAPLRFEVELGPGAGLYEWSYARQRGERARRRFTERRLEPADRLYVLGAARLDEETGLPYVASDPQGGPFVVSARSEAEVRRSYGWGGSILLSFALMLLAAGLFLFGFNLRWPLPACAALAGGGSVLSVAWMGMLFLHNDLVWVREQMRKAMGNLDADLRRRWDLIPDLVAVVKGHAAHESSTLEGVIQGRVAADVPTEINDQTRTLARLYAVVERCPDLKADAVFLDLMRRLTAIENRIALVRTFYNDAVTAYNTRVRTLPDMILAKLGRFELQPLLRIEAFKPRPVEVKFDRPAAATRPCSL